EHPEEIREGMVFALETFWPASDGWSAARIEEQLVVTADGCEVITRFPAEDLIVAGRPYYTPGGALPLEREAQSNLNTRLDVDAAVGSAGRRFAEDWRWRSPRERGALLREVAARIRDHVDELAELEAREVGKPRRDALRFDISFSHAAFDYFAGLADTLHGE